MKRTAQEWCELTGIIVRDPDGWDRSDPNFYENWNTQSISFNEFWDRASRSTTYGMLEGHEVCWGKILNRILSGEIRP